MPVSSGRSFQYPRTILYDCETSGLDPQRAAITELAVMEVEARPAHKTMVVLRSMTTKVLLEPTDYVDPKSLAMNGYDPAVWAQEGITLLEALQQLYPFISRRGSRFAAWNITFDWAFLKRAMLRNRIQVDDCIPLDLMGMAEKYRVNGCCQNVKLATIAEMLNVLKPGEQPHQAWGDCIISLWVYTALCGFKYILDARPEKQRVDSVKHPRGLFDPAPIVGKID